MFDRKIEAGRLVAVQYGPSKGKLATIVDIIDDRRVVIDGPSKLTGVSRQQIPIKWIALTSCLTKIGRGARSGTLTNALAQQKTIEKYNSSRAGKVAAASVKRRNLNDFERFQLMIAKKRFNSLVRQEIGKVKSAAKKPASAKPTAKKH